MCDYRFVGLSERVLVILQAERARFAELPHPEVERRAWLAGHAVGIDHGARGVQLFCQLVHLGSLGETVVQFVPHAPGYNRWMVAIGADQFLPQPDVLRFCLVRLGQVPAIRDGKLGLQQHAHLVGHLQILLDGSPTVMPDVVETVVLDYLKPPAVFLLVHGRTDRVGVDAVVPVTPQEDGLSVQQELSTAHLELSHAEAPSECPATGRRARAPRATCTGVAVPVTTTWARRSAARASPAVGHPPMVHSRWRQLDHRHPGPGPICATRRPQARRPLSPE